MKPFKALPLIVLVVTVASLVMAPQAQAETTNVSTIRAVVISNTPDCHSCAPSHGCYLAVQTDGNDPFNIYIPAGYVSSVGGASCGLLVEGDCVEATGELLDSLVNIPSVGHYNLAVSFWRTSDQCLTVVGAGSGGGAGLYSAIQGKAAAAP